MNYEWRIFTLERELAHLKEMQALTRSHMEAHDASFQAVGNRMDRIEATLEALTDKLDKLVDVLGDHSNGGSKVK
jgi:chromosome segregation ATPase